MNKPILAAALAALAALTSTMGVAVAQYRSTGGSYGIRFTRATTGMPKYGYTT